jgi:hypothetical protein
MGYSSVGLIAGYRFCVAGKSQSNVTVFFT